MGRLDFARSYLRARSTAVMPWAGDLCRITRPGEKKVVTDTVTNKARMTKGTTIIYRGPCRFMNRGGGKSNEQEQLITTSSATVTIPWDSECPNPRDKFELLDSEDPTAVRAIGTVRTVEWTGGLRVSRVLTVDFFQKEHSDEQ